MAWVKERTTSDGDKRFVACYRDPEGRQRSAGTFSSQPRRRTRRATARSSKVLAGSWRDHSLRRGPVPRVRRDRLAARPSTSSPPPWPPTVSNLDKHFFPFFGRKPMHQITPGLVQDWVTKAAAERAVGRGRSASTTPCCTRSSNARSATGLIVANPCAHTELPKVIATKTRTLTPEEFDVLLAAIPDRHRLMVETAIETGMRWGELIALKPRHVDFLRKTITVEETIIEVSKQALPHRRTLRRQALPQGQRTPHLRRRARTGSTQSPSTSRPTASAATTCSSPPRAGTPISRNTFRTRVWQPAVKASGVDFNVRMHDLRHAHASWLLAGGSDLASSWTAWATPRSRPPRSTSTPSPTPTRRTSPPSPAPAADDSSPTEEPPPCRRFIRHPGARRGRGRVGHPRRRSRR